MSRSRAFEVVFDTLALVHMDGIESTYHTLTRKTIDEQLVVVLAITRTVRERLFIGKERFQP